MGIVSYDTAQVTKVLRALRAFTAPGVAGRDQIKLSGKEISATNGHTAVVVEFAYLVPNQWRPYFIGAENLKAKTVQAAVAKVLDPYSRWEEQYQGNFPDVKAVIPDRAELTGLSSIALNPDYIADVAKLHAAIDKKPKGKRDPVRFSFPSEPLKPLRFDFEAPGFIVYGVIMPMRPR